MQSDNYQSGSAGWQIQRNTGNAEFNNGTFRGNLDVAGGATIAGTLALSNIPIIADNAVTYRQFGLGFIPTITNLIVQGSGGQHNFGTSTAAAANAGPGWILDNNFTYTNNGGTPGNTVGTTQITMDVTNVDSIAFGVFLVSNIAFGPLYPGTSVSYSNVYPSTDTVIFANIQYNIRSSVTSENLNTQGNGQYLAGGILGNENGWHPTPSALNSHSNYAVSGTRFIRDIAMRHTYDCSALSGTRTYSLMLRRYMGYTTDSVVGTSFTMVTPPANIPSGTLFPAPPVGVTAASIHVIALKET